MTSSLTWLDYSESDRRRALDVIDLFRETETVDELGLATIGNSYSDLFFPGTSTIQTRACYFLLVPWTFRRLERLKIASSQVMARARKEELRINRRLLEGKDNSGVFGSMAGDALKRLPSEAYWGGLGSWGIRTFSSHKWAYFRSLDGFYRRSDQFKGTGRNAESQHAPPANWHPYLPDPPTGFPAQNVKVALRQQDAEYLRDRILARHPESLLAVLVRRADLNDHAAERVYDLTETVELRSTLKSHLRNAKHFAVCMQGAALLYNLMLSEARKHDDWQDAYRKKLHEWASEIRELTTALDNWKLDEVWEVVRTQRRSLKTPTRSFIERWIQNLNQLEPHQLADNENARAIVRDREVQLKRTRARLTNARRLELWGGGSGTGRLSYRWGSAKWILSDICTGLNGNEGDAEHA